jgi:hypothetical protein
VLAVSCAAIALAFGPGAAAAAKLPGIRTSAENRVPACVTPERLMAFLKSRNGRLDPRYKDIAKNYKTYGEAWRVRWDYAFYQMAIETNFLSYRQPNGRLGDVDPGQNNFAGIGTTGGGVPGDSFPDVKTGVHAQIQHLVVYSGERLAQPIAPRTQLKQDDILKASLELDRPVLFSDLARRWAVDKNYHKSIEWVADAYRSRYCRGREADAAPTEPPSRAERSVAQVTTGKVTTGMEPEVAVTAEARGKPTAHPAVRTVWSRGDAAQSKDSPQRAVLAPAEVFAPQSIESTPAESAAPQLAIDASASEDTAATQPAFAPAMTPPAGLGANSLACSIGTASYGGTRTVLVKAPDGDRTRYTALTVHAGFESSMTASYIKARAPGGSAIGEFDTAADALEKARALCPGRS